MKISKAIIPLAGRATRLLPATKSIPKAMLPVAGSDGILRPIVHYIAEAAVAGGIREICLVTDPAGESIFRHYFDDGQCRDFGGLSATFAVQSEPKGLGDAVWRAEDFADGRAVLVMLGDYIYKPDANGQSPVKVLIDNFSKLGCDSLVGLQQVGPDRLSSCGIVTGKPLHSSECDSIFELTEISEKPDLEYAATNLETNGLPDNNWLAFYGLYAFTNRIFDMLAECQPASNELTLTDAQQHWLKSGGKHLGLTLSGKPTDLGTHSDFNKI